MADPTTHPAQRPSARQLQAGRTRRGIQQALADLLAAGGRAEDITFKRVAQRAGVTEMTVYRHFPDRNALLTGLWQHLNDRMGEGLTLPTTLATLRAQHEALYQGFDRIPTLIAASLATEQGREMRKSLHAARQAAFLGIAKAAAPRRGARRQRQLAALLQLLHGAHAWMSLREQWDMDGAEAAATTRWAIDTLLGAAAREGRT